MREVIQCNNLQQVRTHIDQVDTLIVKLLAERTEYVFQAAQFKKKRQDVRVPERIEEIIARVKVLANQRGLDPDMIDSIYRHLIEQSIDEESHHWDNIQTDSEE